MSLKEEEKVHTQKKEKNKKIVLLIDAENIHSIFAAQIMQYIDKLGNIVVKRIYGDWQSSCIKNWKKPALFYSITPCQQFSITHPHSKTKNTTDIALIIDAMTLLYEKDITKKELDSRGLWFVFSDNSTYWMRSTAFIRSI